MAMIIVDIFRGSDSQYSSFSVRRAVSIPESFNEV